MKVAVIAETFLPHTNGVTHSILRVLDHLAAHGHEAIVIAPDFHEPGATEYAGFPVHRLRAMSFPGYPEVRVVLAGVAKIQRTLAAFRPDVVHVASPMVLGWKAMQAAERLALPTVAIYQTDVPAYAERYGLGAFEAVLWNRVRDIHQMATVTLAPSSASMEELTSRGIERVELWPRGVDTERFNPRRRDEAWRREVAPNGEVLVGYVGRLAAEKRVEDLAEIADLPGTRLVVVGDGPQRERLEKLLPGAVFTGMLGGTRLAEIGASLDVFVHTGELETFGQTIQEAMASGVPVVAPAKGGPIDLVTPSHTGWLYPPGDLAAMRGYVQDLVGDARKRAALGAASRARVEGRTWERLCAQLVERYGVAIRQVHASHHGTGLSLA